jgi:hypothetical protein
MYSLKKVYEKVYLNVSYDFSNSMGPRKSSVTFLVLPPKDGLALSVLFSFYG